MISVVNFEENGMEVEKERMIKEVIGSDKQCYVLITCGEASEDGKFKVEMSYEGDPILAAYLLEGAQNVIDEQITEEA